MIKINMSTFSVIAIFIATFKAQGLPQVIQYAIQLLMLCVVILFLFIQRHKIHLLNVSVIFSSAIILSSVIAYFAGIINLLNMLNGLYYSVCLFCFFEIIYIFAEKGEFYRLIKILYKITIIYNVLSFFSVLYWGNEESYQKMYFFGGKFVTCYYFLFMFTLMYTLYQEKIQKYNKWKIYYVALFGVTILFFIYLKCITAILITVFAFILSGINKHSKEFLSRKIVVTTIVLASGIILFGITEILEIDMVAYIIVNVLKKSISLTARTPIYERYLFPLISERILWGYGYGSSILHRTTPYWNAQNGLFDILLNYGLQGGVAFVITVFRCVGNRNASTYGWGLYILLYALMVASVVEISYNYIFIIALYLLSSFQIQSEQKV